MNGVPECQEMHCHNDATLLVLGRGKKYGREHQVCSDHYLTVQRGEPITLRRDASHVIGYAAGEVQTL